MENQILKFRTSIRRKKNTWKLLTTSHTRHLILQQIHVSLTKFAPAAKLSQDLNKNIYGFLFFSSKLSAATQIKKIILTRLNMILFVAVCFQFAIQDCFCIVCSLLFFLETVHFAHISNELGVLVDKAHLLTDVIQNLALQTDFYKKRTISYGLRETEKLYKLINSC